MLAVAPFLRRSFLHRSAHAWTGSLKPRPQLQGGNLHSHRPLPSLNRTYSTRYVRFSTPEGPHKPPPKGGWQSWSPRKRVVITFGGLATIYYIAHLEQVPDTGRWRFMNTSPQFEAQFGEIIREQTIKELAPNTLPPTHPLTVHVRRVVSRILHASNLGVLRGENQPTFLSPLGLGHDSEGHSWNPDAKLGAAADPGPVYGPNKEWDVIVVNDLKMINAMATPGVIVVFTGILPVCQDEEGLAAVVAHEIGHVVARHSAERLSAETIGWGVALILYSVGLDFGITNLLHTLVMELPNSRKQEHEADLIGLRLMSRACYNPEAAPKMFARLGELETKMGRSSFRFFQTHPSSESRVKRLEEKLPEAYGIMESNPACEQMRHQLDAFRQTAHAVKFDRQSNAFDIL